MYDELIAGRVYFGGADDAASAVEDKGIQKVIDLRVNGRKEKVDYPYIHKPIADESSEIPQSIQAGVKEVIDAYQAGEKVYFHCGGGNGRASVMAVATLMELELADSLEEAEDKVKEVRPSANIRPKMQEALEKLYK